MIREIAKKLVPLVDSKKNSDLLELVITDSMKYRCPPEINKIKIVSIDKLFGEAIRRVSNEESVSTLFS